MAKLVGGMQLVNHRAYSEAKSNEGNWNWSQIEALGC